MQAISFQWILAFTLCVTYIQATDGTLDGTFQFNTISEQVKDRADADGRIRGIRSRENKDFVLGGLFPIHADAENSLGARCGAIRQERGLERVEAMLFALDKINSHEDPTLLPGLELGYDIRDTCNSETIGLDEALDLIITSSSLNIESCESGPPTGTNTSIPTSGIVGAASSSVSVPVASLGRLFRIPQVSYASSTALLNDRTRYSYFLRTVRPDDLQASAMVDILLHFGWNYVSILYSQDTYGGPGMDEFVKESEMRGICLDFQRAIPPSFTAEQYDRLVDDLSQSRAKVVIVFADQETVEEVLTRINNIESLRRNFTWIASDAWARSIDLVHNFNDTAAGLFGVAPLTDHFDKFDDYYSQLTIDSNTRNNWFPEFFAAYANCTLNVTCNTSTNITSFSRYIQGNFVPLVIDAVYAFAHALHNFLDDNCDETDGAPYKWFRGNGTCLGQSRELNGSALLEYLMKDNFTSITNNDIVFDERGNVHGRYEILNYQASRMANGDLNYSFRSVGTWDCDRGQRLVLEDADSLQFGLEYDDSIRTEPVQSECGGCEPGTYVRPIPGSCCSICEQCVGSNYSSDPLATECSTCLVSGQREMWGNNPFVGSNSCVIVPETSVSYSDYWAAPSLVLGCLGLVCVAVTAIIYGIFWKTPIAKSSGREQMVLLLIGIACSFVLGFFYLAPPSIPICIIQRLGLWFCYSLMFGALVIKVQRVARIFYGVKRSLTYSPYFMAPAYQVTFTLIIVTIQMCLIIASVAFIVRPSVKRTVRFDHESEGSLGLPEVILTCTEEHIAITILSLFYESVLICISTILGAFSFKYPENFNESKYISFCTFALLIVWIGLIPTYFTTQSQQEYQNAAISFFVLLSAFAVLIFLFGPKLYLMVFLPKRNSNHFSTNHSVDGNIDSASRAQMQDICYRDYREGKFVCLCLFWMEEICFVSK